MSSDEERLRSELRKHAAICKRASVTMNSVRYNTQVYKEALGEYELSRSIMNDIQRKLESMEEVTV